MNDETMVFNTPDSIEYVRLASLKGRISLESKGLKFRINTKTAVCKQFGISTRTPHAKVIELIQERMSALLAKVRGEAA
jgi:hypothetical protein